MAVEGSEGADGTRLGLLLGLRGWHDLGETVRPRDDLAAGPGDGRCELLDERTANYPAAGEDAAEEGRRASGAVEEEVRRRRCNRNNIQNIESRI